MKKSIAVLTIALLIVAGTIMIATKISTSPVQKESLEIVSDIVEPKPEETEVTFVEEIEEVEEVIQVETYQPIQTYVPPASSGASGNGADFMFSGVIFENGIRYTWYSQNAPGMAGGGLTELNANGRHVDEEGIIRDADGYVAVASCDHEKGTVVDTPFGEGKVYDYCGVSGTIDIYTNF